MNFNLMYSNGHITMGTSADDLFDKSGKNQNSLHYKYNKFLVSPYLPRGYKYSLTNSESKNNENNDSKENENDNPLGETQMYYPKPNNYNSIYTQRFSKKYKDFYNNPYLSYPTDNYDCNNIKNIYKNNPIKLIDKYQNFNTVKTPDYQIKKEIQYQKTPDKYKDYKINNSNEEWQNQNNNIYNNYRRYDDYYPSNKMKRYNSSVISKIAEDNFINQDFNNKNQYSTPGIEEKRRRMYLSQVYP